VRLIVLEVCAGIVALLFLVTLAATASHRARLRAGGACPASGLPEYLWAVVPWVIIAGSTFPAVRLIVATP
jgi:hypothetical protein